MRLREDYEGTRRIICVLVLNDGSEPAVEFLQHLKRSNQRSHKKMVQRYRRHAVNGPSRNTNHERHIVSEGNLWEFKTDFADRLLYFNHSGNRVVLTSGFHSTHTSQDQQRYHSAAQFRDEFLREEE